MPTTVRRAPTDVAAFLAWENRQRHRYELIRGVVRLMSGGTREHDLIAANLIGMFRERLRRVCDVHGSNYKVVSPDGMVAYPDMLVRCGEAPPVGTTEMHDPWLVVEVLSPSTRRDDLLGKRYGYQAIPSLRHILFVDARRVRVEVVSREADDSWRSLILLASDATVVLPDRGVELPLTEIYEGTGLA